MSCISTLCRSSIAYAACSPSWSFDKRFDVTRAQAQQACAMRFVVRFADTSLMYGFLLGPVMSFTVSFFPTTVFPLRRMRMIDKHEEIATLGGGCFWCLSAIFEKVIGVNSVESGYCGGQSAEPDYRDVCSGRTGHAEVVRISFDPAQTGYRELLELFFAFHDPTTPNRQGNDVGTQYRSVIFYHSEQQKEIAVSVIGAFEQQKIWSNAIVTEVRPAPPFYKAEGYHQQYFARNPEQGYCQMVIAPKLAKLRKDYSQRLADPSTAP